MKPFSQRGAQSWQAVAAGLVLLFAGFDPPTSSAQAPPSAPFRADRILVKPRPGVDLSALNAATGVQVLRQFPAIGNLQILRVPQGASVTDLIATYLQSGLVDYAEPDFTVRALLTPNDFRYWDGSLWNLNNIGQLGGKPDADIDAPEGWDVQNAASNIVVAVIDTGVRLTHEDLAANLWTNPGESGSGFLGVDKSVNGLDDDGDGYIDDVHGINAITGTGIPLDDYGHGTHVSGIVGAVGNNSVGVVGVCWRVQLMECKFLDSSGQGSISDAITCIDYARGKGAKIINASWGGYTFNSAALRDAITSTRNAGILFVAATGNNGTNNDLNPLYPASYDLDNIIAVAATTRTDDKATWSNFGATTVDLGAPGLDVFSTWNGSDSDYRYFSGTSMAAPHVVGVCALVWARYPTETYLQIKNRVLTGTDPLPALTGKCVSGGRLNLQKALGTAGVVADFTANPTSGTAPLTVQFTDTSSGTIVSRTWNFGDSTPTSSAQNPAHTYANAGNFTATLTVTGTSGATSSKSQVITVMANYQIQSATFSWIDPSGMTALPLGDDGVSAAQPLSFTFTFYGKSYNQVFVGANGLAGFVNQSLSSGANTDIPDAGTPNAAVYPYWADLDPSQGGSVRFGVTGAAPNRRAVISWMDVPPKSALPTTTRYSFQAVLFEGSNQILFQYLNIQPNRTTGERLTGTVGIENDTGASAAKFTYNESPYTLYNTEALLFVPTASGTLSVTPGAGFSASGNQGGPFSPTSQTYVLQNAGTAPMNWTASADQGWLTVSAPGGMLTPGQQTSVSVSINSQANSLVPGNYTANVFFVNSDNGDGNTSRAVSLTVNQITTGILSVTPDTSFNSQGPPGGPFSPSSKTYTLANTGNAALNWTATVNRNWVSLSATNGMLAPGASSSMTVSLNASANQLSSGTYNANVNFANTTSGNGNTTRKATLKVTKAATLSANGSGATLGTGFPIRITGDPDEVYVVQATSDFTDWVSVYTNRTSSDGWFDFIDPQAGQLVGRYYRALNASSDFSTLGQPSYRSDRVLVKPKSGISLATLATLHLSLGSQVVQAYPAIGNLQMVQLRPGTDVAWAIASYLLSGLVEYAEPDFLVHVLETPNDFRYFDGTQWSLNNTGQLGGRPDADIDAPEGWDLRTTATNVLIAVIDTGARYTHEDLAASMWVNPGEIPGNGIDDDGDGFVDDVHGINTVTGSGNPLDDHGHGTHVSGIIGGVGNNSVGIAGVCWRAQIMACKFLDSGGSGSISDAIRCIDFARSKGAKVINASWGTTDFNSAALRDAIASARDADIIFVAAAGNSAQDNSVNPIYPASFPVDNIVSVAATTRTDDLAGFSNYGATNVHLGAPGTPIFSCWGSADNAYQYMDGTSMAAAHVSGVCALARAQYPSGTYRQIIDRVLGGTDPLPSLAGKCTSGGRLNLQKALGSAPPPPQLPTVTVVASDPNASESGPDGGTFTVSRTGSTASTLTVNYTLNGTAQNGSDYQSLSGSVTIPAGASSANIAVNPIDDAAVEGDETVVLTLSANANYNVGSPNSATVTIADNDSSPPPNQPVVTLTGLDPNASETGPDVGVIRFNRTGDTSQPLTVSWTFSGTAVNGSDYQQLPTTGTIPAGQAAADLTITPIDDSLVEGNETVVVTVVSGPGYTVGSPASATVTIADNDQPPPPAQPVVTLTGLDPNASETGPDVGVIRFNRTGDTSQPLTVSWTFSGTAVNDSDYQQLPATGTIPAGQAAADLTITPIDDALVEGSETVVVTVLSGPGYTVGSPSSATVTIADNDSPPAAPVANFTANPASGNAPLTVQFTDQSTGNITSWDWNFGDGTAHSSARSPAHTYNSAGTFTATLTVTGPGGSNSKSATITVNNPPPPPPVANFTANPASGNAPLTVQFTDQSTGNITSWDWNFGDGTAHSSARSPSHTYNSAGIFTATLTVTGPGGSNSRSATITVSNPPPPLLVADFTANPTSGPIPLTVQFTDKSTGNPITWSWDFGDGFSSTERSPSHTYVLPGNFTATLTVRNSAGATSSKSATIQVRLLP